MLAVPIRVQFLQIILQTGGDNNKERHPIFVFYIIIDDNCNNNGNNKNVKAMAKKNTTE